MAPGEKVDAAYDPTFNTFLTIQSIIRKKELLND